MNSGLLLLAAIGAVMLDRWLGEPRQWHPLVGFGRLAGAIEARWRVENAIPRHGQILGLSAWLLAVVPLSLLALALCRLPWGLGWLASCLCLYFSLGARSLEQHVLAVIHPLEAGDLTTARVSLGRIVSRDTAVLDADGVTRAALETTLENGNDAVFGALFWFALLGGPGAVLFRLANTLDAMWGYKSPRYRNFGWAAARLDDALNWLPARLTALTYALLGNTTQAITSWRHQAHTWDSPNAGPVMASGAGSLGLILGGTASYQGVGEQRPLLGAGRNPIARDLHRGLGLVRKGLTVWLTTGIMAWFASQLI
ncbi:cobalamin biosynthesis protein [Denitratisoma sp. DHT3]|uniref:adenosylcobinamide-phosphate synthase CbiB n=1 Tax=Denitratisoma sp. DHT3 TaxID=1981880 RepID=UPI0011987542|nr:adenosylcobinamide-phosphate synthase CbiB [Denitratisoma sp. DHT3]QDX81603.1 cobalamin biosynthesis protein [Denitratisoma sp. DHT3]